MRHLISHGNVLNVPMAFMFPSLDLSSRCSNLNSVLSPHQPLSMLLSQPEELEHGIPNIARPQPHLPINSEIVIQKILLF